MTNRPHNLRLAVVIPTLNEGTTLAATLASVDAQRDQLTRIVVADGGSVDGTVPLAEARGAQVTVAPRRGRGCQIADAVTRLDEDVILILHADMSLPEGALALVRSRLSQDPTCPGGCLGHRFDSPRLIYRIVEWWDRQRARRGCSFGDQAQFFRRGLIEHQGGFPDVPIMEDVELSRLLTRLGRPAYLDHPVVVSPRRFERLGWWRTVLGNLRLRMAYRCGGARASQAIYRSYYEDAGDQPLTDASCKPTYRSHYGPD